MTIGGPGLDAELTRDGPLDREVARRLLARGDDFLAGADFQLAARYYQRVVGATPDPEQTAAALFGLGMTLYRLDQDDAARSTWEQILSLPETPYTYRAWREIASARVREGDLRSAQRAYLEAQRRAPADDRAEIASRLGWLAKETGDPRGASRYFARSRGGAAPPILTYAIIAVTVAVSLLAFQQGERGFLFSALQLDKLDVANGEYWRLWTVTLLHGNYMHLFFNMYALFLAGTLVEQIYGPWVFGLIYLLSAAAGSVGSFVFGGDVPSVGASGAIFGLFGVLLAVSRTHHPVLDRRGQLILGQMGVLIALNLVFGFMVPGIDISAHIGGLIGGLWLGFILVPTRVPTLGGIWQRPPGEVLVAAPSAALLRIGGVLALVAAIVFGVAYGTGARHDRATAPDGRSAVAAPAGQAARSGDVAARAGVVARPPGG